MHQIHGGEPVPPARVEEMADALATNLAHSFIRSVVELYYTPPRVTSGIAERPKTSDLARLQAPVQQHITTRLHSTANISPFGRKVIAAADGTRTKSEIYDELVKAVRGGELVMVDKTGMQQPGPPVEEHLQRSLDGTLAELSRLGVF
jgi:hypothetical protein